MGFFDELFGGGKKTPFVTDPQSIIKQQDELNRFNIFTQEGGREFGVDPETGRSTLTVTESPFQQQTRSAKEALATSFLSDLSGGDDRFAEESKRIGDLTFERGLSRLEPILETARRRTETQLAAQGLPVGSEARTDELARLSREENDLLDRLAGSSELAAGQEQSRLRGLAFNEANVFADQFGGANVGQFLSGIPQINAAGIVQNSDTLNQNRSILESIRKNTQRQGIADVGFGILTGGQSLAAKGFLGTGGVSRFFGGQSSRGAGGIPTPVLRGF